MKLKLKIELDCTDWLEDSDLAHFQFFLNTLSKGNLELWNSGLDDCFGEVKVLSVKKTKKLSNFIEDLKAELVEERQSSRSSYINLEQLEKL